MTDADDILAPLRAAVVPVMEHCAWLGLEQWEAVECAAMRAVLEARRAEHVEMHDGCDGYPCARHQLFRRQRAALIDALKQSDVALARIREVLP